MEIRSVDEDVESFCGTDVSAGFDGNLSTGLQKYLEKDGMIDLNLVWYHRETMCFLFY